MKSLKKKVLSIMLAFCFVTVAFSSTMLNAQAASKYSKSFTKTITLKPYEVCSITFNVKKKAAVTAKVTTTSKTSNLYASASMSDVFKLINSKNSNATLKASLAKGDNYFSIQNEGDKKVTFKIKFSAKSSVVKYNSKIISTWG